MTQKYVHAINRSPHNLPPTAFSDQKSVSDLISLWFQSDIMITSSDTDIHTETRMPVPLRSLLAQHCETNWVCSTTVEWLMFSVRTPLLKTNFGKNFRHYIYRPVAKIKCENMMIIKLSTTEKELWSVARPEGSHVTADRPLGGGRGRGRGRGRGLGYCWTLAVLSETHTWRSPLHGHWLGNNTLGLI